jgi:arylsulfatase A
MRKNTIVLFTGDNGPETLKRYPNGIHSYGSPGGFRGMKLHVTEGGFREPAILQWPGKAKPGQVSDEPVSGLDLLPTLCEAAGVTPPADRPLDGASFMPLFEGKPIIRTRPLYWQYDVAISQPWTVALREGPWKLLANKALDRFALYNLKDDPAEKQDRAAELPDRVRDLSAKLLRMHREINQAPN